MIKATDLSVGKELCPGYRLRRLLGRGAYGHVWEADADGHPVALKFLPCVDGRSVSHEVRSVQLLRQLSHPHLTRVHQVWCHRGYVVVVMDRADGSLQDLLEAYQLEHGTPVPADEACALLTQAATALDFLNARDHLLNGQRVGLQHGDVKPSNLLLFGETVRLCDFGLCSPSADPLNGRRRGATAEYAAPEVLQGRSSDWADQFALAVTYSQIRTGQLPYPVPRTSGQRPDLRPLPERESAVIARALAPVPPERWPSCGDFMFQLRKAVLGSQHGVAAGASRK